MKYEKKRWVAPIAAIGAPLGARGFMENAEKFLLVAECRKFYPELLRGWPDNAVDNWGTCTCYVSPNLGAVRMATPQEKMGTENGDCHFYDCPHFQVGTVTPTGMTVPISRFLLPPRSLSGVFEFRRFGTVHEGTRRIPRRASLRYLSNGAYLPDTGLPDSRQRRYRFEGRDGKWGLATPRGTLSPFSCA